MSNIEKQLNIEQHFAKVKNKLNSLLKYNLHTNIINELICLCDTYNSLSVNELQQSEQVIAKSYNIVKTYTDFQIEIKIKLLTQIKILKKLINSLIETVIINSL